MQTVPQYIDVEDKIAGPLTWKHLGWIFGGGALLLLSFSILDKVTFFIAAIPIISITAALAFYRPQNVSLSEFIGFGFTYIFQPKVYTWQREVVKPSNKKAKDKKEDVEISVTKEEKKLTVDDVAQLAQALDERGKERNERIQQLIKDQTKKQK